MPRSERAQPVRALRVSTRRDDDPTARAPAKNIGVAFEHLSHELESDASRRPLHERRERGRVIDDVDSGREARATPETRRCDGTRRETRARDRGTAARRDERARESEHDDARGRVRSREWGREANRDDDYDYIDDGRGTSTRRARIAYPTSLGVFVLS